MPPGNIDMGIEYKMHVEKPKITKHFPQADIWFLPDLFLRTPQRYPFFVLC